MARHLDLEWDETLVQPLRDGQNFGGREAFQGVSAASRDRWRDELTPEQAAALEQLLGPRLEAHGYAVDPERLRPSAQRRIFDLRVRCALKLQRLSWLRYGLRRRTPALQGGSAQR